VPGSQAAELAAITLPRWLGKRRLWKRPPRREPRSPQSPPTEIGSDDPEARAFGIDHRAGDREDVGVGGAVVDKGAGDPPVPSRSWFRVPLGDLVVIKAGRVGIMRCHERSRRTVFIGAQPLEPANPVGERSVAKIIPSPETCGICSSRARQTIGVNQTAVAEQGIQPGTLTLTDNGSAFTGRATQLVFSGLGIPHHRGGYRDPESQAFIESWFRHLNKRCVRKPGSSNRVRRPSGVPVERSDDVGDLPLKRIELACGVSR